MLNIKKIGYILPILILLFQIPSIAQVTDNAGLLTASIDAGHLTIQSSSIHFDSIDAVKLGNETINLSKLRSEGVANVIGNGKNIHLTFPLSKRQQEGIEGARVQIRLKSGVLLSSPITLDASQPETFAKIAATKPAGWYGVTSGSLVPTTNRVVNQHLVTSTVAYQTENGAAYGWHFCGQAAMSTALNGLRAGYVTTTNKIHQLDWFHAQLKVFQTNYTSNYDNRHREANNDALTAIMKQLKKIEFVTEIEKIGDARAEMRDLMLSYLQRGDQYIIPLSKLALSSGLFKHYYIVYKINYQPSYSTGGTVYYADPYYGTLGSQDFSTFLTNMRNPVDEWVNGVKVTKYRHSFIAIRNK